ncbi:hypothetical protein JQX13_26485 [Archangium violaceum]|uniref:hypothetical protein n=1 Tax=Archangium violaceum TaxID=83451 RepID=UPI00193B6DF9|nr:hypothetical protein [Archangium violaceum]QRK13265.1 hypothetical protein JQX13_26485 [Archangium violaceum]
MPEMIRTSDAEQAVRSPAHMLGEGVQVSLEGMKVTVLAADAQGPTRLGFDFDAPLEEPSLVFLHWREGVAPAHASAAGGTAGALDRERWSSGATVVRRLRGRRAGPRRHNPGPGTPFA